jgi:hypothetical protein
LVHAVGEVAQGIGYLTHGSNGLFAYLRDYGVVDIRDGVA